MIQAAIRGQGVALGRQPLVSDLIESGAASGLLRRVLTNSARQGLNVRLAPKATEILSHRETTRWANKRSLHTQQTASLNHMLGARNKVWQSFPHLLGSKSRTRTARSFINLSRTALV
jgi:hypothetical protein